MNGDQEQRAALEEARERRLAADEELRRRVAHIRRVDPELTVRSIAKRLEVSVEKVRSLEREAGVAPAPKADGLNSAFHRGHGSIARAIRARRRR